MSEQEPLLPKFSFLLAHLLIRPNVKFPRLALSLPDYGRDWTAHPVRGAGGAQGAGARGTGKAAAIPGARGDPGSSERDTGIYSSRISSIPGFGFKQIKGSEIA